METLKRIRLYRQHLTDKADKRTVVRDLNGLQAQFTVNSFHALKIRCNEELSEAAYGENLVKNWTVRGTVHVFAKDDLPLFCHGKERYRSMEFSGYGFFGEKGYALAKSWGYPEDFLRECQEKGCAWTLSPERQADWSAFIVRRVAEGVSDREELKKLCTENGMTKFELDSMFDSWGGGMRELCERGFLNYKVQEKKAFALCPEFEPMETEAAELEIFRRYLLHYAPATIRDMAYYYGCSQTKVKAMLAKLPAEKITRNGADYFYMGDLNGDYPDIPPCLLLAGFDPLMLGYKKEESVFLPREHLRGIFNLAGIVMPAVLLDGRVVGKWSRKNGKVTFALFETVSERGRRAITEAAEACWKDIRSISWN
ncbi:MAG: winged helix DNA-binding domain-containing protein [Lachnospiraceae bacterium]|nr:winged helix DNA-binding domain-containing protein [Lachnospiraceae bacterium]